MGKVWIVDWQTYDINLCSATGNPDLIHRRRLFVSESSALDFISQIKTEAKHIGAFLTAQAQEIDIT